MLGLVQKILFNLIESVSDQKTLNVIKEKAGVPLDKEFRIDTVYDDDEWQRLYSSTLEVLNLTEQQATKAYANAFLQDALTRFPTWFEMSKNSYEFLRRQPAIHGTLAAGLTDIKSRQAILDKFRIDTSPNKLITYYKSANQQCVLYVELAKLVIDHYKDDATVKEVRCLKNGDSECEIHIDWQRLGDVIDG